MKPRYIATLIALAAVVSIGTVIADNTPLSPANIHVNANNIPPLLLAPEIKNVTHSCCGGSMSSSRLCVSGKLVNKNNSTQTYTPLFTGMKAGECVTYDNSCANPPPGMLCIPKCLKYAPPTKVTAKGNPVTIPAKGTANFSIVAPTHLYVDGTKVTTGGASALVLPVPIGQCVN